jgi:hypothetical protein
VETDISQLNTLTSKKTKHSDFLAARQQYRQQLKSILAPLKLPDEVAQEVHVALRTQPLVQLADHHAIDSYSQNIFRDWRWSEDENKAILGCLEGCLEKLQGVENILVLGSGAGRLGIDIHKRLTRATVHLLDSNPLLSFIAKAMAQGTPVELTEFPRAPVGELAISHTLQPSPTKGGVVTCADALNPPILAESVDLLVTPWLIDVIDAPLEQ